MSFSIINIKDELDIKSYIIEDNLFRRQLNDAWRIELVSRLEGVEKDKAKQRQIISGKLYGEGQYRDILGKKAGVSCKTLGRS